MKVFGGLIGIK